MSTSYPIIKRDRVALEAGLDSAAHEPGIELEVIEHSGQFDIGIWGFFGSSTMSAEITDLSADEYMAAIIKMIRVVAPLYPNKLSAIRDAIALPEPYTGAHHTTR